MKHFILIIAALILLHPMFVHSLEAQVSSTTDSLVRVTDVPRIISYQGQLTTANGQAMNGTHKITATLYSDHLGINPVWQGSYSAEITGGVFSIDLGAGSQKFPDNFKL